MTFGSTHNTVLIQVKVKANSVQQSPERRRSLRGEPDYPEYDLRVLLPLFTLNTWVDFETGRRQEIETTNIDVQGVWEATSWIQDRVKDAIGRFLRVGDQVQFSTDPGWFLLGRAADDGGIFNTAVAERFNLLRSHKP